MINSAKDTPFVYIISGLAADHRVFANLTLPKHHKHLAWIPNLEDETLTSYAKRMAEKIEHPNPIIIGLSFGGIVAQEIANLIPVKKLILLSTIKNESEKPWYFKIINGMSLFNFAPSTYFHQPKAITYWAFSLVDSKHKSILDACFEDVDEDHVKWAIARIMEFKGVNHGTEVIHIHSTGDRIFPLSEINADYKIEGGHFALYTHSEQLNNVFRSIGLI